MVAEDTAGDVARDSVRETGGITSHVLQVKTKHETSLGFPDLNCIINTEEFTGTPVRNGSCGCSMIFP